MAEREELVTRKPFSLDDYRDETGHIRAGEIPREDYPKIRHPAFLMGKLAGWLIVLAVLVALVAFLVWAIYISTPAGTPAA